MILCCGEALIDMIPTPTQGGGEGFVPHSGGAIFNTAVSLGRLGEKTGFLTGLSTDLFGEQLRETLEQSHVDAGFSIRSRLPTTLAFVRLQNGQATYTFYDENSAGRSLTPDQLPDVPQGVSTLYFGGISLIGEPCADFYAALALREASRRVIMLDPNIRTSFIQDEGRYRARLDKMIAVSDILKVSDEDLVWISKDGGTLEDKARAICARGPSVVIVTRGSEGADAYFRAGGKISVPAKRVTVVDTVGAGDTFNAGVLAMLSERSVLHKSKIAEVSQEDMTAALNHGAAVAAVTVSKAGANPPWKHEL